jgi:hypothetical protein
MKSIKILIIVLLLGSACYAQREKFPPDSVTKIHLDGPIRKGASPLYVILHEDKEYELDSTLMLKDILDPGQIKSVNVVKPPQSNVKYSDKGKNGVLLISLNEERYPAAFKELEKHLTILKIEEEKE